MRGYVFLITDPLYLPLKRGGLVCPPLESPVISYEPEERSVNSLEITASFSTPIYAIYGNYPKPLQARDFVII